MDAQKLFEMMKKVQEPKGYFFNKDRERTFELLEALIKNKERYGYTDMLSSWRRDQKRFDAVVTRLGYHLSRGFTNCEISGFNLLLLDNLGDIFFIFH
jgi:ferredoxin-thioredoxin reductase catalytic subunit